MASKKDDRSRNWTFVVYPDSAPEHWRTYLDDLHIQWVESPLHDSDINGDGSPKKAHWHIAVLFEGNKSYSQILELIEPLNCPIPQKIHSIRSTIRYFAHLDNPEKKQYNLSDIVPHGGCDVADYLKPSSLARYEIIQEMIEFVEENDVVEYLSLISYASKYQQEWFFLLCDNASYVMSQVIKSNRHRVRSKEGDSIV